MTTTVTVYRHRSEKSIHILRGAIIIMTQERMRALLKTTPGIGVICARPGVLENCYFYEDFDAPATGIKRAMDQLYPLMDKGVIKKLCFVEQHR